MEKYVLIPMNQNRAKKKMVYLLFHPSYSKNFKLIFKVSIWKTKRNKWVQGLKPISAFGIDAFSKASMSALTIKDLLESMASHILGSDSEKYRGKFINISLTSTFKRLKNVWVSKQMLLPEYFSIKSILPFTERIVPSSKCIIWINKDYLASLQMSCYKVKILGLIIMIRWLSYWSNFREWLRIACSFNSAEANSKNLCAIEGFWLSKARPNRRWSLALINFDSSSLIFMFSC